MQTKYLHISAYACDKCDGPVIAGSFGTRETEITRESALSLVGAACLACGNKQAKSAMTRLFVSLPPLNGLRGEGTSSPSVELDL